MDNQLYSYNAFKAGSTTAYAPVVMNNYYGFNTSVAFQNITSVATAYTVTYGSGQQQTGMLARELVCVAVFPVAEILQAAGKALGLDSAKIESDQPIVVLVNESNNYSRAADLRRVCCWQHHCARAHRHARVLQIQHQCDLPEPWGRLTP